MTMVMDDIQTLESRHVLQTYRRQPVTFVRGKGVHLYDADGREYIDLLSGIGVTSLGHAHEGLTRAITEQAQTLLHTSNLFFHPLQGQLASRLTSLSGLERAFFCNSGTEAIEACLKFARRYWYTKGEPRQEFVALEESFHGRTFGALSVTSDEHYRAPFEPLLQSVKFVSNSDPAALLAAAGDDCEVVLALSSGLKLDQAGLELANVGLLRVLVRAGARVVGVNARDLDYESDMITQVGFQCLQNGKLEGCRFFKAFALDFRWGIPGQIFGSCSRPGYFHLRIGSWFIRDIVFVKNTRVEQTMSG